MLGHAGLATELRMHNVKRNQVGGLLLNSLSIETALGFRISGLIGHDTFRDARLVLDFDSMRLQLFHSPLPG